MEPTVEDEAKGIQGRARLMLQWIAKWGKWLLTIVPLMALAAGYIYHREAVEQYRNQLSPEIDCHYTYLTSDERYSLAVQNVGLVDCQGVWVSETVFVVIGDQVYEGVDLPHLYHFVYHGSRTAMWDLPVGRTEQVHLAELQAQAFDSVHDRFGAVAVCRWRISFSKPDVPKRYSMEKSFIFDTSDRRYKLAQEFVGGGAYAAKVDDYLFSGSRALIGIHPMTGQFEISPPREYMITRDYDFVALYPGKTIPLETLRNILLFSWGPMEVQPSDDPTDGSLRYAWQLSGGRWEKTTLMVGNVKMYSKRIPLQPLVQYLSPRDAARVRANPELLPDTGVRPRDSVPDNAEILGRAARKYIAAQGK